MSWHRLWAWYWAKLMGDGESTRYKTRSLSPSTQRGSQDSHARHLLGWMTSCAHVWGPATLLQKFMGERHQEDGVREGGSEGGA